MLDKSRKYFAVFYNNNVKCKNGVLINYINVIGQNNKHNARVSKKASKKNFNLGIKNIVKEANINFKTNNDRDQYHFETSQKVKSRISSTEVRKLLFTKKKVNLSLPNRSEYWCVYPYRAYCILIAIQFLLQDCNISIKVPADEFLADLLYKKHMMCYDSNPKTGGYLNEHWADYLRNFINA